MKSPLRIVVALVLALMCAALFVACSGGATGSGSASSAEQMVIGDKLSHEGELKQPFWVLLMGCDTRANTTAGEPADPGTYNLRNSDTMILLRVWPEDYKITMVTIPRDTQVDDDGHMVKISEYTAAHGIDAAVRNVEKMAGINIKYHFATDFARFVDAIDALGGIDVVSPINMQYTAIVRNTDSYELSEGENHLDGEGALGFARARKVYAGFQDACRQIQDRQIIQKIIEVGTAGSEEVRDLYARTTMAFTDTDLPEEDLRFYIDYFSENRDQLTFMSGTAPYEGWLMEEYELWMVPYDEAKWTELFTAVENGEDPTKVVPLPEVAPF